MFVMTKQAYHFRQELGRTEDDSPIWGENFRLPLSDEPVPAPDWIKETRLWGLAMKDGTLKAFEDPRG